MKAAANQSTISMSREVAWKYCTCVNYEGRQNELLTLDEAAALLDRLSKATN